MNASRATAPLVALGLLVPAAFPADPGDDLLGVLWVQTAAEYRALCRQVFASAAARLDEAKRTPTWSAALEQIGAEGLEKLPPAIVVDVDETVLDNSPYNARLIEDEQVFALTTWASWVREEKAAPVPGALRFLTRAAEHGIAIFYVTNRAHELLDETRSNLERLGFPVVDDSILTRNQIDEAGSEKTGRRAHIARHYRVLMLIGDDLGDFIPRARTASREQRARWITEFDALWGTRWFVLPNPIYGSWLRALADPRAAVDPKRG